MRKTKRERERERERERWVVVVIEETAPLIYKCISKQPRDKTIEHVIKSHELLLLTVTVNGEKTECQCL